jgi:hypothetical protein
MEMMTALWSRHHPIASLVWYKFTNQKASISQQLAPRPWRYSCRQYLFFSRILIMCFRSFPYHARMLVSFSSPTPAQLHYNTLSAATSAVAWFAHVHFALWGAIAEGSRAWWVWRHFLVVPTDLADKVVECVFDVNARLRGCFDKFAAKLLC